MCMNPVYKVGLPYGFPCGKCVDCLLEQNKIWTYRIMAELSQHKEACFVTLTYNEDNRPERGDLDRRACQLFLKRLRKSIEPLQIRYFLCGEYGELRGRPHYHIIIFGWIPKDLEYLKTDKKGNKLFVSPTISKLWRYGFHSVGYVTEETAKYTAKYMSKIQGRWSNEHIKPFFLMSRRPGIGSNYNPDFISNKMYYNGHYIKLPRYYRERLRGKNDFLFSVLSLAQKRKTYSSDFTYFDKSKNIIKDNRYKKMFGRFYLPYDTEKGFENKNYSKNMCQIVDKSKFIVYNSSKLSDFEWLITMYSNSIDGIWQPPKHEQINIKEFLEK